MSSILNMEQVALSSLPTGLFLEDGQTYYIQNNQNVNLSSCLSGDIVQQALEGLNTNLACQTQWDVNKQKTTSDQNYFVLNKDKNEGEENVVQLSISDDFPIHLLNSTKNEENIQNTNQQKCLVENVLCTENEKSENSLSVDSLNSLLQLSPNTGSNELFDSSSTNLKGNVTYAYQLTNGTKINQLIQNACLTMPINSANGLTNMSQPTKPTESVQVPPEKQNGKRIVLLRGMNIKPRLLLNLKNKGTQEAAKNVQTIRIVPANSLVYKNQRNIAPQKMALPPLNRPKSKDVIYLNQNNKTLQNLDIKSKPPPTSSQVLSNFLKAKAVTNPASSAAKIINSHSLGIPKQDLIIPEEAASLTDSSLLLEIPKSPNNESKPAERLSESELKKIATAFQNGDLNIDKINNSATIYDSDSKTKIICRIVYPEELVEGKGKVAEQNGKKRMRGRRPLKKDPPLPEVVKKVKKPENLARTRSGRLSRPPRYMLKDFKKLKMENSDISCSENETEEDNENIENTPTIYKEGLVRRRTIKSKCPTCGKSYPGRKMLVHLTKYPDHGDVNTVLFTLVDSAQKPKPPTAFRNGRKRFLHNRSKMDSNLLKELSSTCSDDVFLSTMKERFTKIMSPWEYIVERQPAGEGAVKGLLSDLSDIVNSIPNNMLQKAEPSDPNAIQIFDERLCHLLNITPGAYLPNDSAIKPPKPTEPDLPAPWTIPMETEPIIEQKLEDKSENVKGVNSSNLDKKEPELSDLLDKSSLETVDEILNERLNDLIPLDDVSSLVESQSLDRSIFSTNSLELHSVSESTEDLLKTLENLAPELPPVTVPTDFDFTVLSSDFVNER